MIAAAVTHARGHAFTKQEQGVARAAVPRKDRHRARSCSCVWILIQSIWALDQGSQRARVAVLQVHPAHRDDVRLHRLRKAPALFPVDARDGMFLSRLDRLHLLRRRPLRRLRRPGHRRRQYRRLPDRHRDPNGRGAVHFGKEMGPHRAVRSDADHRQRTHHDDQPQRLPCRRRRRPGVQFFRAEEIAQARCVSFRCWASCCSAC